MSHVTGHVSHVICHISCFLFVLFLQSVELFGGGSVINKLPGLVFPELANSVVESPCPSVCMYVRAIAKHSLPEVEKLLVEGGIANFGLQ